MSRPSRSARRCGKQPSVLTSFVVRHRCGAPNFTGMAPLRQVWTTPEEAMDGSRIDASAATISLDRWWRYDYGTDCGSEREPRQPQTQAQAQALPEAEPALHAGGYSRGATLCHPDEGGI